MEENNDISTEWEMNSSDSNWEVIFTEGNITKKLYWHLLWKKWYMVVTHQFANYFWIADIFAVNKSLYTHEIEVKVSKADFLSEMKDIEYIINWWEWLPAWRWSKYNKHLFYINQKDNYTHNRDELIPNYFSFAVPSDLVRFASEKLQNTPYWLIEVYSIWSYIKIWSVLKQAKKIHKNKICFDVLLKIAHRMSYINEKNINKN